MRKRNVIFIFSIFTFSLNLYAFNTSCENYLNKFRIKTNEKFKVFRGPTKGFTPIKLYSGLDQCALKCLAINKDKTNSKCKDFKRNIKPKKASPNNEKIMCLRKFKDNLNFILQSRLVDEKLQYKDKLQVFNSIV
jgi:hypothetical protein